MKCAGIGAIAIVWLASAAAGETAVTIQRSERDGQPVVVIENQLYKTVLAYSRARLPLSYVFKATGHEQFVMPTPLDREGTRFQYYGGIIDSIPWVSGPGLQSKGHLWSSEWEDEVKQEPGRVVSVGRTTFDYEDPLSKERCTLRFEKTTEGYAGTSCLAMRYLIENAGQTNAKFMLSVHSRTGIGGGHSDGDYFYAPGHDAQIYYMHGQWEELKSVAVKPPFWTRWPLDAACRLRVSKEPRRIFAFLPAPWCCVGDDKEKECLFFVSSPVNVAGRIREMRMGIFMTNGGYVVEPCPTYRISAESWDEPEATLMLKPGERCTFTLCLVAYGGITEQHVRGLGKNDVLPDCLITQPLRVHQEDGKTLVRGTVVSPGKANLTVNITTSAGAKKQERSVDLSVGRNEIKLEIEAPAEGDMISAAIIARGVRQAIAVSQER